MNIKELANDYILVSIENFAECKYKGIKHRPTNYNVVSLPVAMNVVKLLTGNYNYEFLNKILDKVIQFYMDRMEECETEESISYFQDKIDKLKE